MTNQESSKEQIAELVPPSTNSETYENDSITLRVDRQPHCVVSFTITVNKKLIDNATKLGVKKVSKDVSIPGFRKGKAPESMILSKFPGAVDEKVRFEMAQLAYVEAQQLARTPLLNQDAKINFDIKEFTKDHAVLFYQFETEPTIPDVDPSHFSTDSVTRKEVSEKEIDETIEQIRSFYSTFETVNERPAAEDDHLLLDIEDLDSTPPTKVFTHTRFHLKQGVMADWMHSALMGMSVGESKEALSRANESDDEELKAQYQPKQVRLTVVGIEIAALPVVDDEFAKKLGVQTVDEMRSQLRKQLHLREERAYHQALRNSISAQLLTNYGTYDIPQSILLKEVEHRSKSYMASPEHRKLAMSRTKEENENFHRELLKESADAIRMFFLCKHIVDKNHIRFSFEDSANQPSNMIEAMFQGNPKPAFNTLSKEEQALQYSRKMLTAAEDFLIDRLQKS